MTTDYSLYHCRTTLNSVWMLPAETGSKWTNGDSQTSKDYATTHK